MRLRIATATLFLLGLTLLVAWPWVVGPKPGLNEPLRERKEYVVRLGIYFLVSIITFFSAALCAYFLSRRTRSQLRDEAKENLKELIEGTLHDHQKKPR